MIAERQIWDQIWRPCPLERFFLSFAYSSRAQSIPALRGGAEDIAGTFEAKRGSLGGTLYMSSFVSLVFPFLALPPLLRKAMVIRTFFLASRHCLHFQRFSLRRFVPGPTLPSSPSFSASSLDPSPGSGSSTFRNVSDVPPGVGDRRRGSTTSRVESAMVLLSRYSRPSSICCAIASGG